jgi:thiol-disulfide isomerase/thioredoxin
MRSRRGIIAIGAAIIAILLIGGGWALWHADNPPPPPALAAADLPPGFKAVDPPQQMGGLAFRDADGKSVSLADFRGKPVVLNIWATWCAPCVVELPKLDQLQAKAGPDTLAVVAVNVDQKDPAKVRNFLLNRNMDAIKPYLNPEDDLPKTLAIKMIPISILIDRNGYALARADAPVDWFSDYAFQFLMQTVLKPEQPAG